MAFITLMKTAVAAAIAVATTSPVSVTPEQIAQWKEKYGEDNVHMVLVAVEPSSFDPHMLVEDDVEKVDHIVGYLRKPDEKILAFALQQIAKPQEAGAIILKNCWLGGDERLKTDKGFLGAAAMQCLEFIQIRQAKLKKA